MISPAPKPKTAAQREIGLLAALDDLEMLSGLCWGDLAPPDPDPEAPPAPLCWEAGWDEPALSGVQALPAVRPLPVLEQQSKPAKPGPERQEVIDSWDIPPPRKTSPPDGSVSAVLPEKVTATLGSDGDCGESLLETLESTIEKRFHHPIQPAPAAPLPTRRPVARIEERVVVAQSAKAALRSMLSPGPPPVSSPPISVRARPKLTLEDYRKHRRDGR